MQPEQIYEILEKAYFSENCDEKQAIAALPSLLKHCKNFMDVGASLGNIRMQPMPALGGVVITAVEADPVRFVRLQNNCKMWEKAGMNKINVIHGAVAEGAGIIEFQTTHSNISGGLKRHSLDHLPPEVKQRVQWDTVKVPALAIDDICRDFSPDVVKMDIEGAEFLALKGAVKLLARRSTIWIIELHDFAAEAGMSVPTAVRRLMRINGYVEKNYFGKSLFRPRVMGDHFWIAGAHVKRYLKKVLHR